MIVSESELCAFEDRLRRSREDASLQLPVPFCARLAETIREGQAARAAVEEVLAKSRRFPTSSEEWVGGAS